MTDLKGFIHAGVDWSWPEFDDATSAMLRPAHALAGPGTTACGETWPHQWSRELGPMWAPRPGMKPGDASPALLVPPRAKIDEIRDGDRATFLCAACCRALKIQHHAAGPREELP